jgi:pilus assembly protein CpaF
MLKSFQPATDNAKILVVDDEPAIVQALGDYLEANGYQVSLAGDGEEAWQKISNEDISLVLTDVMMPGLDGFGLCERIKKNRATVFLPVVLVTALARTEDRVKGAQVGADDFITKPPDEQELLTRIKSLLRMKALHDALEASNHRLREVVTERTEQLENATVELQRLLEEKAHFSSNLTPAPPNEPGPSMGKGEPKTTSVAEKNVPGEVDAQALRDFKNRLLNRLAGSLEGRTDLSRTPEMVALISERLAQIYEASDLRLPADTRQQMFREIVDEILGYGPIEPLLADNSVTEVMVNGPHLVYVERDGKVAKTDVTFDDDDHVLRIIDRIIRPLGRRVDRKSPMVDARLPDGSRVNAIIPPCAIAGPTITIRKFSVDKLTVDDLIGFGSITPPMAQFLEACVRARLNIVVSGGTGSGKTTLLNVLSAFIPEDDRIVTIEDSAELQLHQEHVVPLETAAPDLDGSGEVSIRDLVKNSLRMRPERIVVGEVRGGEALDMLQAMNTGHDGSLTTVHANTPRDSIARLETLVLMAELDLPLNVVRAQIASAVDVIVQQSRLKDGSRKVINVTEVQGMEGDVVVLSDIFAYKETGMDNGRVVGQMEPTGIRPKFSPKLELSGFKLPAEMFMTSSQLRPPNPRSRR